MNRINEFKIEPGTYADDTGALFVVLDIVTHRWNDVTKLHEALPDPEIIYRDLEFPKHHIRYSIDMKTFRIKFLLHKKIIDVGIPTIKGGD